MQNTSPLFAHVRTSGKSFCLGSVFSSVGKDKSLFKAIGSISGVECRQRMVGCGLQSRGGQFAAVGEHSALPRPFFSSQE